MDKNLVKMLMMQLMADAKDEFMNEFRDVVKEVIKSELMQLDRDVITSNSRLTYDQISEEYHISKTTLMKLKKEGVIIPIAKGGKTLIFDRKQVEEGLRDRPRNTPDFLRDAS